MKLAQVIIGVDLIAALGAATLFFRSGDDCWIWLLLVAVGLGAAMWFMSEEEK